MEVFYGLTAIPSRFRGGVLSIGKFDGLHCGHISLLNHLTEEARKRGVPSVILTFKAPPVNILEPQKKTFSLCRSDEKIKRLSSFGIDALVVLETSRTFLNQTAKEFFENVILRIFSASLLVEGEDFNFGKRREGNIALLRTFCASSSLELDVIPVLKRDGQIVSSSRIRALIAEGNIQKADELLNRPYRLTGTVVSGEHRGRTLGFPTINLGNVETILPCPGVYAAAAWVEEQKEEQNGNQSEKLNGPFCAATNVGANPTFGEKSVKIESYLIGFQGDLYKKTVHLDFYERLRDVVSFSSAEQLMSQMNRDIHQIQLFFQKTSVFEK